MVGVRDNFISLGIFDGNGVSASGIANILKLANDNKKRVITRKQKSGENSGHY